MAFLKLVPLRDWLYIGVALALFGGYVYWTHHQRAIGREQCAAAQLAKQDEIDRLQARIDAQAAAQNAPILTRYNALTEALATYDRSPIALPGCGRVPDDIVRAVNAAHARQ